MKRIFFALALVASVTAEAREIRNVIDGNPSTWRELQDAESNQRISSPCKGQELPLSQSRLASGISLVCEGSADKKQRSEEKFDPSDLEQIYILDQQNLRSEMQEYRRSISKVGWTGSVPFRSMVTWQWRKKMSGQNGARCDWNYVKHSCKKKKQKWVDDEPSTPGGGGRGSGSGGRGDGGGGGYESEGGSPWGALEPVREKAQVLFASLSSWLMPTADARWVDDGWEYYDCYDKVANSCVWEEIENAQMACENHTLTYDLKYIKSGSSWTPSNPKYVDLLANGYDLLPGETENVEVSLGGRSTTLAPKVEVENAWNKYNISIDRSSFRCEVGARPHINIEVQATERIRRKSPNALALPKEGGKKHIAYNKVNVDGKSLNGRPYVVRLQDKSANAVTTMARNSRQFDQSGGVEKSVKGRKGESLNRAFWKNTQFRIRLYQREKWGRDILFSRQVNSNGSYLSSVDGQMNVPLEGERGVESSYVASGSPLFLGKLLGVHEIELTPGKTYEFGISMYQKGLWFYDDGCESNDIDCIEGRKINEKAFSEELIIPVDVDPNVDQRLGWQKFIDWQRKSLWQKLGFN